MTTEQLLLAALSLAATIIVVLGGFIVKGVFKMADRITSQLQTLNSLMASFVRRDECVNDMESHCKLIRNISSELGELKDDFTVLKTKAEMWHKEEV